MAQLSLWDRFRDGARAFSGRGMHLNVVREMAAQGVEKLAFVENYYELDQLYEASWLVQAICDIPSEGIANRWRDLEEVEEASEPVQALRMAEKKFALPTLLTDAYSLARLFGSSLLIPVTNENALDMPLNVGRIRPGDLKRFMVVDRFHVSYPGDMVDDFGSEEFGHPEWYDVTERGITHRVHHSRMFRMDGVRKRTESTTYNTIWGRSIIPRMLDELNSDRVITMGIAHLVNEASMMVIKTPKLARARQGKTAGDVGMTLSEMAAMMNQEKSLYKTIFVDKMAEIERLAVQFTDLPKVQQEFMIRLAGAAGIPATTLWGRSPAGQNATGESDLRNLDQLYLKLQRRWFNPALYWLDPLLLADQGVTVSEERMPLWDWPGMLEKDKKQEAESVSIVVDAVIKLKNDGLISPTEGRGILDGLPFLGELPGDPPETSVDPDEEAYAAALAELEGQQDDDPDDDAPAPEPEPDE